MSDESVTLRRQRLILWSIVGVVVAGTLLFLTMHEPPQASSTVVARVPHCSVAASKAKVLEQDFRVLTEDLVIPEVQLTNQYDEEVRLAPDLISGKVVALNFIFTTCEGVCPPMGATFGTLRRMLGEHAGQDVELVSITVDPVIDTPERLNAWSEALGGGPGWTLLTGSKLKVEDVLKRLQVFSADKNDHSPFILVGDPDRRMWSRMHGLTPPKAVHQVIKDLLASRPAIDAASAPVSGASESGSSDSGAAEPGASADAPARRWFTDVKLVDQNGTSQRLYSDVLHDKIVVVHAFFTECKTACPALLATFGQLQEHIGKRLGDDIHLVSLTVDPVTDTPAVLKGFAERLSAKPGWFLLTGEPQDVDLALHRFGYATDKREEHSNVFIVGNLKTGLWKKVQGLSDPKEIARIVDGVIADTSQAPGVTAK